MAGVGPDTGRGVRPGPARTARRANVFPRMAARTRPPATGQDQPVSAAPRTSAGARRRCRPRGSPASNPDGGGPGPAPRPEDGRPVGVYARKAPRTAPPVSNPTSQPARTGPDRPEVPATSSTSAPPDCARTARARLSGPASLEPAASVYAPRPRRRARRPGLPARRPGPEDEPPGRAPETARRHPRRRRGPEDTARARSPVSGRTRAVAPPDRPRPAPVAGLEDGPAAPVEDGRHRPVSPRTAPGSARPRRRRRSRTRPPRPAPPATGRDQPVSSPPGASLERSPASAGGRARMANVARPAPVAGLEDGQRPGPAPSTLPAPRKRPDNARDGTPAPGDLPGRRPWPASGRIRAAPALASPRMDNRGIDPIPGESYPSG